MQRRRRPESRPWRFSPWHSPISNGGLRTCLDSAFAERAGIAIVIRDARLDCSLLGLSLPAGAGETIGIVMLPGG